ncbi:MAG: hypothetical protein IJ480_03065, partial [Clostridia bacterium]|nr:hypothetical protein [Clostridia bacterium]
AKVLLRISRMPIWMQRNAERFVFRCDFLPDGFVRLFLWENTDYLAVTIKLAPTAIFWLSKT